MQHSAGTNYLMILVELHPSHLLKPGWKLNSQVPLTKLFYKDKTSLHFIQPVFHTVPSILFYFFSLISYPDLFYLFPTYSIKSILFSLKTNCGFRCFNLIVWPWTAPWIYLCIKALRPQVSRCISVSFSWTENNLVLVIHLWSSTLIIQSETPWQLMAAEYNYIHVGLKSIRLY